jgi:hypothetical protein
LAPVAESTDGTEECKEDEKEEERLRLVDGDAGLQVQLGQDTLPGDSLSQ